MKILVTATVLFALLATAACNDGVSMSSQLVGPTATAGRSGAMGMMAVMMSQQLLVSGRADHEAVVPFARHIRDTQHDEIQMMSPWLRNWFGIAVGMR